MALSRGLPQFYTEIQVLGGPGFWGCLTVVEHFRADFDTSERRACSLAGQSRSVLPHQDLLEDWQTYYNTVRPHTALGGLAPGTFLAEQSGPHGALTARPLTPDTPIQPAVATP